MCAGSGYDTKLTALLQDPLVRLVMASDGVTDDELRAVVRQVQASLHGRRIAANAQSLLPTLPTMA